MKKSIFWLFLFLILPASTNAATKAFVYPGVFFEQTAQTDFISPVSYTWEIREEGEQKEVLQGEKMSYMFDQEGRYSIFLTVTDQSGETEETETEVVVGDVFKKKQPLKAVVSSLPSEKAADGSILVPPGKSVLLYAGDSTGDIGEYRIDTNIMVDSNNDGDPENDIDNAEDASLFYGSPFLVDVFGATQESSVASRLIVVDIDGNESSADITFIKGKEKKDEPLYARISTLPPANEKGEISFYGDMADVTFAFYESSGNILQYRLDADIAKDSNGDGDPANDMDNKNDKSFTDGSPMAISFSRKDGERQTVRFIAVAMDENGKGKGSALERSIVFSDRALVEARPETQEMSPQVIVNKQQAKVGEEIEFYVLGVPAEAEFAWDFNGDGSPDVVDQKSMIRHAFRTAGEYRVGLTVVLGDRQQSVQQEISIVDPQSSSLDPVADFTFEMTEGVFQFTDTSTADSDLQDGTLTYEWDFGDGNTSTEQNPEHTYSEAGEYIVSLQVTDSSGLTATVQKTASVLAEDIPESDLKKPTVADFTFEMTEGVFQFTDTSTADSDLQDGTLTYEWDFGDGNTSTEQNPEHTYQEAGEYIVSLQVTDSSGESSKKEISLTAGQEDPLPLDQPDEKKGFPWWKIVFILLFFAVGGILVYFFIKKVESPDLGFGEIFREELERWMDRVSAQQKPITKTSAYNSSSGSVPANEKAEVINTPSPFLQAKKQQDPQEQAVSMPEKKKEESSPLEKPSTSVEKRPSSENTQKPNVLKKEPVDFPLKNDTTPEWLKDISAKPSSASSAPTQTTSLQETKTSDGVPDWLKGKTMSSPPVKSVSQSPVKKSIPQPSQSEPIADAALAHQETKETQQTPKSQTVTESKEPPFSTPPTKTSETSSLPGQGLPIQQHSRSSVEERHAPQNPSVQTVPTEKTLQQNTSPLPNASQQQGPVADFSQQIRQNQKEDFSVETVTSQQTTQQPFINQSSKTPLVDAPKEPVIPKAPFSDEKNDITLQKNTNDKTNTSSPPIILSAEPQVSQPETPPRQDDLQKSQEKKENTVSQHNLSGEAILSESNNVLLEKKPE